LGHVIPGEEEGADENHVVLMIDVPAHMPEITLQCTACDQDIEDLVIEDIDIDPLFEEGPEGEDLTSLDDL
jgi:hypothetical protein